MGGGKQECGLKAVTEKAKQKFLEKARKLMNKCGFRQNWSLQGTIWLSIMHGKCFQLNSSHQSLMSHTHTPHFQGIQIQPLLELLKWKCQLREGSPAQKYITPTLTQGELYYPETVWKLKEGGCLRPSSRSSPLAL